MKTETRKDRKNEKNKRKHGGRERETEGETRSWLFVPLIFPKHNLVHYKIH